jgi:hypothetical protein
MGIIYLYDDIIGSGDAVIVQRLQTETERERLIREALEREQKEKSNGRSR